MQLLLAKTKSSRRPSPSRRSSSDSELQPALLLACSAPLTLTTSVAAFHFALAFPTDLSESDLNYAYPDLQVKEGGRTPGLAVL
jgi:hypothetical protein